MQSKNTNNISINVLNSVHHHDSEYFKYASVFENNSSNITNDDEIYLDEEMGSWFASMHHCRMSDKSSMFLSTVFKNLNFLCSF